MHARGDLAMAREGRREGAMVEARMAVAVEATWQLGGG